MLQIKIFLLRDGLMTSVETPSQAYMWISALNKIYISFIYLLPFSPMETSFMFYPVKWVRLSVWEWPKDIQQAS